MAWCISSGQSRKFHCPWQPVSPIIDQEVVHARADVNAMKTIVRRQMVEVHKAEKELEDARNRLKTVMQERKVQEKLREKAFEEFKQELAEAETKEIDELVSYTYNKGEQGE